MLFRSLNTPLRRILAAFAPALSGAVIMTASVLAVLALLPNVEPLWQLVASISSGIVTYALALWFMQRDLLVQVQSSLRLILNRS